MLDQKEFADLTPLIKKIQRRKILITKHGSIKCRCPSNIRWIKGRLETRYFYRTVMSDLSDLKDVYYDILAFFSPTGIKSLFKNFPDFKQNDTRIAVLEKQQKKKHLTMVYV